jgi:hypothetical protein
MNIELAFGLVVFFGALAYVIYDRCKNFDKTKNLIDY